MFPFFLLFSFSKPNQGFRIYPNPKARPWKFREQMVAMEVQIGPPPMVAMIVRAFTTVAQSLCCSLNGGIWIGGVADLGLLFFWVVVFSFPVCFLLRSGVLGCCLQGNRVSQAQVLRAKSSFLNSRCQFSKQFGNVAN